MLLLAPYPSHLRVKTLHSLAVAPSGTRCRPHGDNPAVVSNCPLHNREKPLLLPVHTGRTEWAAPQRYVCAIHGPHASWVPECILYLREIFKVVSEAEVHPSLSLAEKRSRYSSQLVAPSSRRSSFLPTISAAPNT